RIVTRSVDGYAEIKISDTGKGIPEENLSKIFDPFFTTKEVGKGTGLGLNVVYNIIEKHNGTIDAESMVGKGTTFTIRIPVQKEV
ncbi:MAG: HAMP domain-containing histidine kinase, partial [Deltaproteobacteria bacterium]|nr:HAMP domain-containing histidine kinase [Deltaproteobacteria bacterium]